MNKLKTQAIFLMFALFCALPLALSSCASGPEEAMPAIEQDYDEEGLYQGEEGAPAAEESEPEEEGFSASAFAQKLLALLDEGDFASALACFDELEEPEASSTELLKLKLSILVSSRDIEAASSLADFLEARLGEDADVLHARAVIALAENKPAERDKRLRQILKIDPDNTDAMISLGDDSLARKAYGDAARWYARALAADGGNAAAHRGLAHSYYIQGRMNDARQVVERALALHPDDASLHVESALIYAEERQLPAALNEMRSAVSLAPDEASYWSAYGALLVRASKLPEAREALSEAIRLDPSNSFPYLYRCGVNDTLGFLDEAIADYRVVTRSYPQYYFAAEGLGTLLWMRGDFRGAKNAFGQAFARADDNLSYALMFTACCYKLGEKDEARRFIGRYMNTLKDRSSVEYFVCRLFFDLSGDADVVNRVSRIKDSRQRSRLMFYVAVYYELFQGEAIAFKFYSDIAPGQEPSCFEERLAAAAIENGAAHAGVSRSSEGAR